MLQAFVREQSISPSSWEKTNGRRLTICWTFNFWNVPYALPLWRLRSTAQNPPSQHPTVCGLLICQISAQTVSREHSPSLLPALPSSLGYESPQLSYHGNLAFPCLGVVACFLASPSHWTASLVRPRTSLSYSLLYIIPCAKSPPRHPAPVQCLVLISCS